MRIQQRLDPRRVDVLQVLQVDNHEVFCGLNRGLQVSPQRRRVGEIHFSADGKDDHTVNAMPLHRGCDVGFGRTPTVVRERRPPPGSNDDRRTIALFKQRLARLKNRSQFQ